MTVELEAVLNDGSGQVAGSIPITFADFGVEAPNLGFVSVEPETASGVLARHRAGLTPFAGECGPRHPARRG